MALDVLERVRQPEYTGANRCVPCTVLNLGLAVGIGLLLGRRRRVMGLVATASAVALIALRGYLVPGTPTLTKRYLPASVRERFGKNPAVASGFSGIDPATDGDRPPATPATDDSAAESGHRADPTGDSEVGDGAQTTPDGSAASDLEAFFLDQGILEPCADGEDLRLTDAFDGKWVDAMELVESEGIDAASVDEALGLELTVADAVIVEQGDAHVLRTDAGIAGRWPSRAALLADIAACRVLTEWDPDWDERQPAAKGQFANALRLFLERCPTGGPVTMGEEVVESCCSSHDVIAVTCEESGERLFEQRVDDGTV